MIPALAALALVASLSVSVGALLLLRRRRLWRTAQVGMVALVLALTSALLAALGVSIHGYRAFIREDLAAVVEVDPRPGQRFEARFRFPDGDEARFELQGDQLYVDAHILKWQPAANLLGLHTAYELDRVAGRWSELEDERSRPRSVYSLARDKPMDMFNLRRRFPDLAWLVDAEYGSAAFILADTPATFEVRVTTSGLILRQLEPTAL